MLGMRLLVVMGSFFYFLVFIVFIIFFLSFVFIDDLYEVIRVGLRFVFIFECCFFGFFLIFVLMFEVVGILLLIFVFVCVNVEVYLIDEGSLRCFYCWFGIEYYFWF